LISLAVGRENMRTRRLGNTGVATSAIGYGAAGLSSPDFADQNAAAAVLETALSRGVTLIDTADTYCASPHELHQNERLVAAACAGHKSVLIATKGGTIRTPAGWALRGDPDHLYRAICESHAALGGTAPIPLWQHHWPDPRYSIEQMLQPVRRAQDEGLIRFVGVGNYNLAQLREACDLLPIVSIQNQYNLWHRSPEDDGLFQFCDDRRISFFAWRPLGGAGLAQRLGENASVAELAQARGVSPQRLVLAWMLHQSPCVTPLIGSRNGDHIADALAAAEMPLSPAELSALNRLDPAVLPGRERPPAWHDHPPLG
jgi:aryl-alcohol dehydrogenase-like predicted oxidoreductase